MRAGGAVWVETGRICQGISLGVAVFRAVLRIHAESLLLTKVKYPEGSKGDCNEHPEFL
jgi:hypothetical protein